MRGLGSAACLSYPHKNKTRLADKLHRWICQSQAGWFLDVFLRAETCRSLRMPRQSLKKCPGAGAMLQDPEQPHRVCCLDHDELSKLCDKAGYSADLSRLFANAHHISPFLDASSGKMD